MQFQNRRRPADHHEASRDEDRGGGFWEQHRFSARPSALIGYGGHNGEARD